MQTAEVLPGEFVGVAAGCLPSFEDRAQAILCRRSSIRSLSK